MQPETVTQRRSSLPITQWGRQLYGGIRRQWLSTVIGSSTTQKVVAVTFDDGPNAEFTPQILDVLERHAAKATFFMLGQNVAAQPELAREVVRRGHAVGNHTFAHPRLSDVSPLAVARELSQCNQAIRGALNETTRLMRPPQGAQKLPGYLMTRLMGYTTIHWSASGDDWNGDSGAVIAERVLRKANPGAIILLHDGLQPAKVELGWQPGERERVYDRKPTIEALETILTTLGGQGYQFVTVPTMLEMKPIIKKVWFV